MAEFFLFFPQMRTSMEDLVTRARNAEAAGFKGLALMDHLAPPKAESQPSHDAMIAAAWVLSQTERLKVGHLVLCDAFRHPAVLANQAVSLDHASGGRFELGIGWGSVPSEFETFGVMSTDAKVRVARLAETLDLLEAFWTGEPVNFDGEFFKVKNGQLQPPPLNKIPVLIGGVGKKTLKLVEKHAEWWNCPTHRLDAFDEAKTRTGGARVSIQEQVTFIPSEDVREDITQTSLRRFGSGPVVGNSEELIEHYRGRMEMGVERFYVWFTDFATPTTLDLFGKEIISVLGD